jgi:glycosyltransferase involved in cell wall biosynthesis
MQSDRARRGLQREGGLLLNELVVGLALLAFVLGGLGLIAYALSSQHRMRELVMRERIALIEKGLVPPPEVDPAAFDRALGGRRPISRTGSRYRSAGIVIMGFGLAMIVLLAFAAGTPAIALGVGGGWVILGAALFVNGWLVARDEPIDFPPGRTAGLSTPEPPDSKLVP